MLCSKVLLIVLAALVVCSVSSTDHRDAFPATPTNCTLTLLNNASDYTLLDNATLHYTFDNATYFIVGYSVQGSPIVCFLPMSKFISVLEHGLSFSVRRLYQSLTIIFLFLSLALLILSVVCFASEKTIFSLIVMCLALSLTMGDTTMTLNAFGYNEKTVCIFSGIMEHFSLIAQFSLLGVLGTNFAIKLHRTANGVTTSYPAAFFKLLYLCVGWGPSLLFIGVTMVIQSLSGDAQYGQNGFCHLNSPYTIVLLLVVPMIVGWTVAIISLLLILLYLFKIQFSFDSTDKKQCMTLFMLLVAMAVIIIVTVWTLLDESPLTHVSSLFVCLFAKTVRSLVFLVGFMSTEQLMSRVRSSLTQNKRHIHPTPSPSLPAHSTSSHDDARQTIACLYPVEAAELVRIMSDPTEVPPIYTCRRCHSIDGIMTIDGMNTTQ